MHYRSNFFISLGIWIALIPFLGIPRGWRDGLVVATGLFLLVIFLGPIIIKKLQTKPKRVAPKTKNTPDQGGELRFTDITRTERESASTGVLANENVQSGRGEGTSA